MFCDDVNDMVISIATDLSVHLDIFIVQEYYGILLFIFLLTSTAVSTQHMLCITGSITLITVTIRLCANMCVHMCVYVRVSVIPARVLTSRCLRMLAEHRNMQPMSRNVNKH